jgi:hypothetical protein
VALTNYITQVRRLLHDPNGALWSDSELTDYINDGRNRVCQDTKCLRQVTSVTLTAGVEQYTITTLADSAGLAPRIVDVMGIDLYWGSTRYSLSYAAWTVFNANLRYWQNMQQRPIAFTRMGGLQVFFGPVPDQAYLTDWTVAINPNPLVTDATVEEIPVPFTESIRYWAAYQAKFKEQAMGEANIFENEYRKRLLMNQRSFMTRVIPDPYMTG